MSVVDIVIIALVVLFGTVGVIRGVQKSALSFGAFLVSFILAFFLAKVVAEAMLGIVAVKDFVIGTEGFSLYTWLNTVIPESAGTSDSFLDVNFFKPMLDVVEQFSGLQPAFTKHNALAMYAAFVIFSAICGVGIYIIARLLMCIVTMIVKAFIDKKKSWLNRLFGFLIGVVRGVAWGFVITLVFSMVGGAPLSYEKEGEVEQPNSAIAIVRMAEGDELGDGDQTPDQTPDETPDETPDQTPDGENSGSSNVDKAKDAFKWLNNEYDNSVLGKYFNQFAYTVRNKLLLPELDMFSRIVDKSGIIIEEDDKTPSYELSGDALDIYCMLMNVNYIDDEYTVEDGKLVVGDGAADKLLRPQDYSHTGFSDIMTAVMDYNVAAAQKIKDGVIAGALPEELAVYKSAAVAIGEKWMQFTTGLRNYENYIAALRPSDMDIDAKIEANEDIAGMYEAIAAALADVKAQYEEVRGALGALELADNPPVYRLSIDE